MENGEEFKNTSIGLIPLNWTLSRLDDVAQIQQGISKGKSVEKGEAISVPYMRVANVKDGYFDLAEIKEIKIRQTELPKYRLKANDILITEGGDPDKLGRGSIWQEEVKECVFQNHLFRIRTESRLLPSFLNNYLQGYQAKRYFLSCAKQTTGIASINSSQVKNTPIPIPPKPEQQAIVSILSTWDKAIDLNAQLLYQRELQKKWLMQHLLTGKKRLPGFGDEWDAVNARSFFDVRNEQEVNNGVIPLFSLTIENGVTEKTDRYEREFLVKEKGTKKYKIAYPDDIVFNPANLRWGAIAKHERNFKVLLSPIYEILTVKSGFNIDFIKYLVSSPQQILFYASIVEGTLIERMAVKIDPFLSIKYKVPSLLEQNAIANVLMCADKEIQLLKCKLDKLKDQKKGLMQALLTGKVRLKVEAITEELSEA